MNSFEKRPGAPSIRPKSKSSIIPRREKSSILLGQKAVEESAPEPEITTAPEIDSWIGTIFGLWLSSVFLFSLIGRATIGHGIGTSFIIGGAVCWSAIYFLLSNKYKFVPRGLPTDATFALIGFLFFTALSIGVSSAWITSATFFVMTLLAVFVSMQFSGNLGPADFERGLKVYAFITVIVLALFAIDGYRPGVRLGNETGVWNPNALALVAMSVVVSAMAFRNSALRYSVAFIAAVVIYLTGARTAAGTTIIALSLIFFFRTRQAEGQQKMMIAFSVVALLVIGAIFIEGIIKGAEEFFAVNDPLRGVGSGATGRVEAWGQAFNLFLSNPITGVGYRAHAQHLTGLSSAHNGYLALLAEVGIIAFSCVIYLIYTGIMGLKRLLEHPEYKWTAVLLFGYSVGFTFEAFFERYLINFGNPASLLLLVVALRIFREAEANRSG